MLYIGLTPHHVLLLFYLFCCFPKTLCDDDLIYSGSGCFDDEEKCTGFVEIGSGDDLITPIYIPPKSVLTSTSSQATPIKPFQSSSTIKPVASEEDEDEDEDEDEECVDEEDDCIDGSGSGETSPATSSTEKTVIITISSTPSWTSWTAPSYIKPSTDGEQFIDYEEPSLPRTPRPMPPPLPLPPRPYPTTKFRLPTRPTGTPPIINVPLPEQPSSVEKEKQKPILVTAKGSADTTAMIIGLIAVILIVIVIVTPLFLFLKVRYRTGTAYKTNQHQSNPNFRFLSVTTGAPSQLFNSSSQSTHLTGPLLEESNKGQQMVKKKKDGMEWYV